MHQGQTDLILLIGSLMHLVNTRTDISFAVKYLSQFMVDPQRVHWTAVKHILRYIKGTMENGLVYEHRGSVQLVGFTNVDRARCVEENKSTLGCCCTWKPTWLLVRVCG